MFMRTLAGSGFGTAGSLAEGHSLDRGMGSNGPLRICYRFAAGTLCWKRRLVELQGAVGKQRAASFQRQVFI